MKILTAMLFFLFIGLGVMAQNSTPNDRGTKLKSKKTLRHVASTKKATTKSNTKKQYRATYVAVANNNKYPQTIEVGEMNSTTVNGEKRITFVAQDGSSSQLTKKECELKIADLRSRIEKTKSDKVAHQHAQTTGWYETTNADIIQLENILKNF